MLKSLVLVMLCSLLADTSDVEQVDIRLPHVAPAHMDSYYCVPYQLPVGGSRYIVKYQPRAEMNTVHHIMLFACHMPHKSYKTHWKCHLRPHAKCVILYVWALNAGGLEMPADTGMHVGGDSGYNYLLLQLHYLHVEKFTHGVTDNSGVTITMDKRRKTHLAGVYLVGEALSLTHTIPPHQNKWHIDSGCSYIHSGPTFHAFRFRVHTHYLGVVVTGYRVRDGRWTLIGRGDPQQPQSFNPTVGDVEVRQGDKLMMRCTFNSQSRRTTTVIGPTHKNEMCRFYLMYYYDATKHDKIKEFPCSSSLKLAKMYKSTMKYPEDSDKPKTSSTKRNDPAPSDTSSNQRIEDEISEELDVLDDML